MITNTTQIQTTQGLHTAEELSKNNFLTFVVKTPNEKFSADFPYNGEISKLFLKVKGRQWTEIPKESPTDDPKKLAKHLDNLGYIKIAQKIYVEEKMFAEAAECYLKDNQASLAVSFAELAPAAPRSLELLATLFRKGSDTIKPNPKKALEYYEKLLQMNPFHTQTLLNYCTLSSNPLKVEGNCLRILDDHDASDEQKQYAHLLLSNNYLKDNDQTTLNPNLALDHLQKAIPLLLSGQVDAYAKEMLQEILQNLLTEHKPTQHPTPHGQDLFWRLILIALERSWGKPSKEEDLILANLTHPHTLEENAKLPFAYHNEIQQHLHENGTECLKQIKEVIGEKTPYISGMLTQTLCTPASSEEILSYYKTLKTTDSSLAKNFRDTTSDLSSASPERVAQGLLVLGDSEREKLLFEIEKFYITNPKKAFDIFSAYYKLNPENKSVTGKLARLYHLGSGCEKDIEQALKLYQQVGGKSNDFYACLVESDTPPAEVFKEITKESNCQPLLHRLMQRHPTFDFATAIKPLLKKNDTPEFFATDYALLLSDQNKAKTQFREHFVTTPTGLFAMVNWILLSDTDHLDYRIPYDYNSNQTLKSDFLKKYNGRFGIKGSEELLFSKVRELEKQGLSKEKLFIEIGNYVLEGNTENQNCYHLAAPFFRYALKYSPDNQEALYGLARCLYITDSYNNNCLSLCLQILKIDPKNQDAIELKEKAISKVMHNLYMSEMQSLNFSFPNDHNVLALLAVVYYKEGDYIFAETLARKAQKITPMTSYNRLALKVVAYSLGKRDLTPKECAEALILYEQFLKEKETIDRIMRILDDNIERKKEVFKLAYNLEGYVTYPEYAYRYAELAKDIDYYLKAASGGYKECESYTKAAELVEEKTKKIEYLEKAYAAAPLSKSIGIKLEIRKLNQTTGAQ